MIACVISLFMHSVVLANPTENNEGKTDGTAKDTNNKDDDEEENSNSPYSHESIKCSLQSESSSDDETFDDCQDSKNTFDSPQDDLHQPSSTLPSHNLTLDAISIRDEKSPLKHRQKPKQPTREEFEHVKKDEDLDMKEFIKQVVYKKYGDTPRVKFFDAAIVYDEEDYSEAQSFRDDIMSIMKSTVTDDLRIELFDSEQFAQSKILVVKDVVDKCSVVLLYLTEHFSSPELNLFVEESIAMTRFGYSHRPSEGSLQEFALKPVHTQPKCQRKYPVPVGLLSLKGINWYDKSIHTRDQLITLFKNAITLRKQREASAIPEHAYQSTFGHKSELQRQQFDASSLLTVTMPPEEERFQQMSNDGLSLLQPRTPSEHTYISSPQHYRNPFHFQHNDNVSLERLQHHLYDIKQVGTYNVATMRHNLDLTQAPGNFARYQNTSPTNQMVLPTFQNTRMSSPVDVSHMSPDYHLPQNNLQQQNVQSPGAHYPSIPTYDMAPSFDLRHQQHHQQHHYHQIHVPGANTQLHYGADPNSRIAAFGHTNTTHNTPNVTTSYTSNLSTDDVEIDHPVEAKDESNDPKSDKNQLAINRLGKEKNQIHTDTSDSDSESSDDEYTTPVPVAKRPKHKVINITGCSVVQLGTGNTVSQPSKPRLTIQKRSRRRKSESQISTRKETVKQNNIDDQFRGNSISEDNLSFTSEAAFQNERQLAAPVYHDTNLNIPSESEDIHIGEGTNNIADNRLYSKSDVRGFKGYQGRSKRHTKLNVTVNADTLAKICEDTANHSPDSNEDELFMSGPLETMNHSPVSNHESVLNAPFTFSRTRQFPHILKNGASVYKALNPTIEITKDSDLD